MESAGRFCWQGSATDLPAPKKSLERPISAVMARVSFLRVGLLEATRTDVAQGNFVARLTNLVSTLLGTSLELVESNADILSLHVRTVLLV